MINGCTQNENNKTNELLPGNLITFGRKGDNPTNIYFEFILPNSKEGMKSYPRLSHNQLSFFFISDIKNDEISNNSVENFKEGRIRIGESIKQLSFFVLTDYINDEISNIAAKDFKEGRARFVEYGQSYFLINVMYGSDNLVEELSNLNKYEIANKKVDIISRVYKLRGHYLEELKRYLEQVFILSPMKIQILEDDYNFDTETLVIGNRKTRLSLDEAKKLFNKESGEVGNRKIECSLVKKVKMVLVEKNKFWSIENSKVVVLQEEIFNSKGDKIFNFEYKIN
jgi:hypothetical protein